MNGYYIKDYLSKDILKLSVGSVDADNIRNGALDILEIIKSY